MPAPITALHHQFLGSLLILLSAVSCAEGPSRLRSTSPHRGDLGFRLDSAGHCRNQEGAYGLNQFSLAELTETKFGECGDFTQLHQTSYLRLGDRVNLAGSRFDHSYFYGWDGHQVDVRFASFAHTDIVYFIAKDVDFSGADLSTAGVDADFWWEQNWINQSTKFPDRFGATPELQRAYALSQGALVR